MLGLCAVLTISNAMLGAELEEGMFTPDGELAARIRRVHERFASVEEPAFTDRFILADVMLDPEHPRRFDNFSGDVSGRYFGALALAPYEQLSSNLPALVHKALEYQHEDGRFGEEALVFSADEVGREHMALLWGNGRLLVGLMEYLAMQPGEDEAVLEAARKLGDFLIGVFDTCAEPEVAKRLEGQAAHGFICFTQLIEGLDLLYDATKDPRYLETARRIVPLLEPRGIQHSHGYLTTLRGYVMLYETTGEEQFLALATEAFNDLLASDDYKIYGGVREFFGDRNDRDEGCSEADFLRLSLQLWRATGDPSYLETGERCLLNIFYANQFETGDFGHRRYDETGYIPALGAGRAWWCCSMHGLRALADVADSVVTQQGGITRVNLFQAGVWRSPSVKLRLSRPAATRGVSEPSFRVEVLDAADEPHTIAVREPSWARGVEVLVNGELAEAVSGDGYLAINRQWTRGDVVDVTFAYAVRFITAEGEETGLENVPTETTRGALFYGPWLLGVDEVYDPMYHGEPWRNNEVLLEPDLDDARVAAASKDTPFAIADAQLVLDYIHSGFPEPCTVTLRPVSEQTAHPQSMVTVWLRYRKELE